MDSFLLTLAFVFLPGIIWARFDARYVRQTKPSQFALTLNAFLFGIIAYAITFGLYLAVGRTFDVLALSLPKPDAPNAIDSSLFDEVIVATLVALLSGIVWLYAEQNKWVTRLLQRIGATRRYGDEDVWDFMFTSTDLAARYINVRDFQQGVVYTGWVEVFSESDRMRELVLINVEVYNSDTADLIYTTPRLYIARAPEGLTIEFPATDADKSEDTNNGA